MPGFPIDEELVEREIAAQIVLGFAGRGSRGFLSPEPAHGIGENGPATMAVVPEAFLVVEFHIAAHVGQRGVHLLIGQRPVAEGVIEIAAGVLEINAEGFAFGLADKIGIGVATAQIYKAANGAEHAAELVRALPGGGETADASTARAAEPAHFRILADGPLFFHLGNDFLQEKSRIAVAEAIVFQTAIAAAPGIFEFLRRIISRIDKDGNDGRDVPGGDQIIQHRGHAPGSVPVLIIVSVLKDHEPCTAVIFVLGGDIDPPLAFGVRENLALPFRHFHHPAFRHARLAIGIGMAGGFAI